MYCWLCIWAWSQAVKKLWQFCVRWWRNRSLSCRCWTNFRILSLLSNKLYLSLESMVLTYSRRQYPVGTLLCNSQRFSSLNSHANDPKQWYNMGTHLTQSCHAITVCSKDSSIIHSYNPWSEWLFAQFLRVIYLYVKKYQGAYFRLPQ